MKDFLKLLIIFLVILLIALLPVLSPSDTYNAAVRMMGPPW